MPRWANAHAVLGKVTDHVFQSLDLTLREPTLPCSARRMLHHRMFTLTSRDCGTIQDVVGEI
jgi:hypothetical protein